MNPLDFMYAYMHKKEGRLEKFRMRDIGMVRIKRYGWHCTFGIAHCGMLHTKVDDVISILSP